MEEQKRSSPEKESGANEFAKLLTTRIGQAVLVDRFLSCTDEQLFMAFLPGMACRPADINLLIWFFLNPRASNPGWGDWSGTIGGWSRFLFVVVCLFGQVFINAFACNANGLDAVQRLEEKKASGDKNRADMRHCGRRLSIVNMFGSNYVPWLEKHGILSRPPTSF